MSCCRPIFPRVGISWRKGASWPDSSLLARPATSGGIVSARSASTRSGAGAMRRSPTTSTSVSRAGARRGTPSAGSRANASDGGSASIGSASRPIAGWACCPKPGRRRSRRPGSCSGPRATGPASAPRSISRVCCGITPWAARPRSRRPSQQSGQASPMSATCRSRTTAIRAGPTTSRRWRTRWSRWE